MILFNEHAICCSHQAQTLIYDHGPVMREPAVEKLLFITYPYSMLYLNNYNHSLLPNIASLPAVLHGASTPYNILVILAGLYDILNIMTNKCPEMQTSLASFVG